MIFIEHTPTPLPYSRRPFCKSTASNSKIQRKALYKTFKGKCFYCKCDTYMPEVSNCEVLTNTATIEHLYPIFDLRRAIVKNDVKHTVLACSSCNNELGFRLADRFWEGFRYEPYTVNILHIWLTGHVILKPYDMATPPVKFGENR